MFLMLLCEDIISYGKLSSRETYVIWKVLFRSEKMHCSVKLCPCNEDVPFVQSGMLTIVL
jgi:hypothetical protein